jgi:hypothetical protein
MDDTPNLKLPYIAAAQAQKHVTHNEAIRALDALVQITVADRDLTEAPESPGEGDRYIVAADASGAWGEQDGKLAAWQDGAWMFYEPVEGWLAWVADEDVLVVWDGSDWSIAGGGAGAFGDLSDVPSGYGGAGGRIAAVKADESGLEFTAEVPLIGVNATPDTSNRLAVASDATLFNHAGSGHQHKINKNAAADTASLLFQTDFSGRAEFGTTGDDDWHVKVSADGTDWHEAIVVDKDTGDVQLGTALRAAGYLRAGGSAAPANTSAGDVTANRLSVGNSALGSGVGAVARFTGMQTDTPSGSRPFFNVEATLSPASHSSSDFRTLNMETQPNAASVNFNTIEAGFFANRVVNSGTIAFAAGVQAYGFQLGGTSASMGTVTSVAGIRSQAVNSFSNALTATVASAYGVYVSDNYNGGSGPLAITGNAGIAIAAISAGTNNTGLLIGTTTIPSGNWGIYSAAADSSYFAGSLGIGTTNPSAKLHVEGPVRVGSYTVAGVPSAATAGAGAIVLVSDEAGGAVLAFSDGSDWRRVTDRAVIS